MSVVRRFHVKPKRLFRFFECAEWAEQFANGQVRISLAEQFRRSTDHRRYEFEGEGSLNLQTPFNSIALDRANGSIIEIPNERLAIKSITYCGNPFYLLCASSGSAKKSYMSTKYGGYYCEILDPIALLEVLSKSWAQYNESANGSVLLEPVRYNRDQNFSIGKDLIPPRYISYAQLDTTRREEHEYRYILFACLDQRIHKPINITLQISQPHLFISPNVIKARNQPQCTTRA